MLIWEAAHQCQFRNNCHFKRMKIQSPWALYNVPSLRFAYGFAGPMFFLAFNLIRCDVSREGKTKSIHCFWLTEIFVHIVAHLERNLWPPTNAKSYAHLRPFYHYNFERPIWNMLQLHSYGHEPNHHPSNMNPVIKYNNNKNPHYCVSHFDPWSPLLIRRLSIN